MSVSNFSGRARGHTVFSLRRVGTIAGGTFTQLVRMKVFALMAVFAVLLIAAGFAFSGLRSEQELKMLKDVAFAAMALFSMVFAIAGTAVLLPRDVEDRTLYTILCKPVPRIEYLLGKLLGVAGLLFVSVLVMDLLFCGVLYVKQNLVLETSWAFLEGRTGMSPEEKVAQYEAAKAEVMLQGVRWPLQGVAWAIFLKSVVLAGVALLLSTFSTSTLFTIMASLAVLVIGHMQSITREVLLGDNAAEPMVKLICGAVAMVFPDFKTYDVADAVVVGHTVPWGLVGQMTGLTVIYLVIHVAAAWFSFSDKEL